MISAPTQSPRAIFSNSLASAQTHFQAAADTLKPLVVVFPKMKHDVPASTARAYASQAVQHADMALEQVSTAQKLLQGEPWSEDAQNALRSAKLFGEVLKSSLLPNNGTESHNDALNAIRYLKVAADEAKAWRVFSSGAARGADPKLPDSITADTLPEVFRTTARAIARDRSLEFVQKNRQALRDARDVATLAQQENDHRAFLDESNANIVYSPNGIAYGYGSDTVVLGEAPGSSGNWGKKWQDFGEQAAIFDDVLELAVKPQHSVDEVMLARAQMRSGAGDIEAP